MVAPVPLSPNRGEQGVSKEVGLPGQFPGYVLSNQDKYKFISFC